MLLQLNYSLNFFLTTDGFCVKKWFIFSMFIHFIANQFLNACFDPIDLRNRFETTIFGAERAFLKLALYIRILLIDG